MPDGDLDDRNTAGPRDGDIRVTCACGWAVEGHPAVVVPQVQDHGRRLHNMDASVEDVLAMAHPA